MQNTPDTHYDDDVIPADLIIPSGSKNYITPHGWQRLKKELYQLVKKERPELTVLINWAASNGDRSENADYQYGKRRLREIDRRIHFLTKRLEIAEVVDPCLRENTDQVFFSATVTFERADGSSETVSIVGVDETNAALNHISWTSPVARSLLKARDGDIVLLRTPAGIQELEVVKIQYCEIVTPTEKTG